MSACSRQPEPVAASAGKDAQAPASTRAAPPPATAPATESGLSIKRGIAMLAPDHATFRPCGENAELWLVDQSDGAFAEAFAPRKQGGATTVYIEAYGERAPPAEDIEAARAYAGAFVLEQVLYAGSAGEVRGCAARAPDYVVAARGNEPFWSVEVRDAEVLWRQPEAPKEIGLGAPRMQSAEGAVRYEAGADGHQLELLVEARECHDSMSAEFFAWSATAVLDGRRFTGCARVGR